MRLGAHGPTVSVVGLGASHFGRICDLQRTRAVVDAALDASITFIDTAPAYPGSEELLGEALQGKRSRVVLSSKFGHPHTHPQGPRGVREVIRTSLDQTLRRLRTDFLDVYVMHMPDPATPLDATLGVLHELVREGRVGYVGLSNHLASDLERATNITCVQERYNLLNRAIEADILPLARERGVGVVPAVPLASGVLTARPRREAPPPARVVLEQLHSFADARGLSILEVAIGWLAAQPGIGPVITGATRPEQIVANARAADWQPSATDLVTIDRLTESMRRSLAA